MHRSQSNKSLATDHLASKGKPDFSSLHDPGRTIANKILEKTVAHCEVKPMRKVPPARPEMIMPEENHGRVFEHEFLSDSTYPSIAIEDFLPVSCVFSDSIVFINIASILDDKTLFVFLF